MELDVFNIQHMMDVEDMEDATTTMMIVQSSSSLSTVPTTIIRRRMTIVSMDGFGMDIAVWIQENTTVMLESIGMERTVRNLEEINTIRTVQETHSGMVKSVKLIRRQEKTHNAKMVIIGSIQEKLAPFNNPSTSAEAARDDRLVYFRLDIHFINILICYDMIDNSILQ
jgi:hypothetical protein